MNEHQTKNRQNTNCKYWIIWECFLLLIKVISRTIATNPTKLRTIFKFILKWSLVSVLTEPGNKLGSGPEPQNQPTEARLHSSVSSQRSSHLFWSCRNLRCSPIIETSPLHLAERAGPEVVLHNDTSASGHSFQNKTWVDETGRLHENRILHHNVQSDETRTESNTRPQYNVPEPKPSRPSTCWHCAKMFMLQLYN